MIIKNSILKNKYYIILLIILFTSVDTILFGTNGNRTMNYLPRFMALVGIIFLMSRYIKRDTALIACNVDPVSRTLNKKALKND